MKSLTMFARCLIRTIAAMIHPTMIKSFSINQQATGKVAAPSKEPTDIRLLIKSPHATIARAVSARSQLTDKIAPKAVATPLPPLKR